MKLMKVQPAYNFSAIDRLINDFVGQAAHADRYAQTEMGFRPATNLFEFENDYKIELQIPGFSKEQISLSLDQDLLVVKGSREAVEAPVAKYSRVQFVPGNFEKKFKLNEQVNPEQIRASVENGVLSIVLPKKQEAAPVVRNIEIA